MDDRNPWLPLGIGILIGACVVGAIVLVGVWDGIESRPNTTISADGGTVTIKSAGSITLQVYPERGETQ